MLRAIVVLVGGWRDGRGRRRRGGRERCEKGLDLSGGEEDLRRPRLADVALLLVDVHRVPKRRERALCLGAITGDRRGAHRRDERVEAGSRRTRHCPTATPPRRPY